MKNSTGNHMNDKHRLVYKSTPNYRQEIEVCLQACSLSFLAKIIKESLQEQIYSNIQDILTGIGSCIYSMSVSVFNTCISLSLCVSCLPSIVFSVNLFASNTHTHK